MLRRLKIRSKLLLLLATPLVAVVAFALSGVVDRTQAEEVAAREARLAQFADASAELSTALQVERFEAVLAGSLRSIASELRPDEVATDQALARWNALIPTVWNDIGDTATREKIRGIGEGLNTNLTVSRGRDMALLELTEELNAQSSELNDVLAALGQEAAGLELFRTLEVANDLIVLQDGLVRIGALGDAAIAQGRVPASLPILVDSTVETMRIAFDDAYATLPAEGWAQLDALLTEDLLPALDPESIDNPGGFDPVEAITEATAGGAVAGGANWTARTSDRLTALSQVLTDELNRTAFTAAFTADTESREALQFLLGSAAVVLLALVMALVIGRSVSTPLTTLTRNAQQLSTEELPAMVESLRSAGQIPAPPITPIRLRGRDEVAQLGQAFSDIQRVTVEVAEEQGNLLRRGISDIFVNLARRNQSLLDRQIDFIDRLESREENPDQLENLFRLDHLATRMRRNAESLLVLAGAEPTRRRGRPVELADVVRVAMGEIEDFSRIQLVSVDAATVAGSVAVDLAHLLSELMENATQFSPPDAGVEVVGQRMGDGGYQVTLTDHGIGMSAQQLEGANAVLADPPLIGLEIGHSLGFTVVGRLSDRLGVDVRLTPGANGGVVAVIVIPPEMIGWAESDNVATLPSTPVAAGPVFEDPAAPIAFEPAPSGEAPLLDQAATPEAPTAPTPVADAPTPAAPPEVLPTRAAPAPQPAAPAAETPPAPIDEPVWPVEPAQTQPPIPAARTEPPPLPTRRPRPEAVPAVPTDGDLFDVVSTRPDTPAPPADPASDLFAAIDGRGAGEPAAAPNPVPDPPGPAIAAPPIAGVPTPTETSPIAGVPVPAATPTPVPSQPPIGQVAAEVTSAGLIRRTPKQVDIPQDSKYDPAAAPAQPAMTSGSRSPEEVRQMLSRYRSGLRKGRGPDTPTDPSRTS